MPLDQWPCIPTNFQSVFPGDLPYFLQAGMNNALGRAVSIIDPHSQKRFDSFNRFDNYEPFCHHLRWDMKSGAAPSPWDRQCTGCDLHIASRLINMPLGVDTIKDPPVRYRCYLGLEEIATVISVGGMKVMVVSGQFLPRTGPDDIKVLLTCVGKHPPRRNEVSDEMWQAVESLQLPDALWTEGRAIPADVMTTLHQLSERLQPAGELFEEQFIREAKRIQEIAERYYEMAKTRVEADIMRQLARLLSRVDPSDGREMWQGIGQALELFNRELGFQFSAFFAGNTEADTVLHLRSSAGDLPPELRDEGKVHFNWRKARLRTEDGRDQASHELHWFGINLAQTRAISKGLKGINDPETLLAALIPVKLPKGPFGLLALGAHHQPIDLQAHEAFILSAGRDLGTRVLALQLSNILTDDRTNWVRTAQLSGHRVRSSVQSIQSQLKTIKAVLNNDPAFTQADRTSAEGDLNIALQTLTELSYATESNIPGNLDVKSVRRSVVPIGTILLDAVSTQQDLADDFGITIKMYDEINSLPPVRVSQILMRSAFINLINNGLKYSFPHPHHGERVFRIKPAYGKHDAKEVWIEFVNFGLGIKDEDRERIFGWGVRLSEADSLFREVYGKGIGLWEVRHIINGHGGRVSATSTHYSKAPVDDQNIKQCITTFTVVLPAAVPNQAPKGVSP